MVSLTKTNPAPTKASTGLYCCYMSWHRLAYSTDFGLRDIGKLRLILRVDARKVSFDANALYADS